jgi:hypothetical protein
MSHRTALAISIALTLVLATGVVIARDRLFVAEAGGTAAVAPVQIVGGQEPPTGARLTATGTVPRVIEIPLTSRETEPASAFSDDDERGDDDGERAEHEDDDGDEHDGDEGEEHD